MPGELDALAADLESAAVAEGLLWYRPGGVVVPRKEPARLLVTDPDDALVEQRGCACVIRVMVRVDEVRHLVAHSVCLGDLVDRALNVVADGRRRVEQDDAVFGRQER